MEQMTSDPFSVDVESLEAVRVGPGCYRRSLPSVGNVSVWIVEMEPGSEWPYVDQHDELGEHYYVISGEVLERSKRVRAGEYAVFAPNSNHRPRTETGVRMIGFNLTASPATNEPVTSD
jgi:mannose-6-phosphate isomerase-like protein (cupin superfamily)